MGVRQYDTTCGVDVSVCTCDDLCCLNSQNYATLEGSNTHLMAFLRSLRTYYVNIFFY